MNRIFKCLILLFIWVLISGQTHAQPWSCSTYPDEAGFKQRMEDMLPKIADKEFGQRSLVVSKIPDTGLPVKVWAIEGEEIISPYTGRKYIQGPSGYFGPKTRNNKGEMLSLETIL